MTNTVERTALSAFTLAGKPVRAGQIVTLDPVEFDKAVAAGLVERDASRNAAVPKSELPELKREAVNADVDVEQARVAEARQAADLEIETIDKRLIDRRSEVSRELGDINTSHEKSVAKAKEDADAQIVEINKQVTEARDAADKEIAAISAEVDAHRQKAAEAADASKKTGSKG